MATKIIISEKQLKRIVNNHLQEDYWQPADDKKWDLLEKDLRFVVEKIIDKHKSIPRNVCKSRTLNQNNLNPTEL